MKMFNVNLYFISISRCILTLLILNQPVFGNHTEPSADESMYKIRVKVNVSEGTLEGIVDKSVYGDSYNAFRGIPYAKPPVGNLRFRDPQPPEPWFGDRDASFYRNVSLQKDVFWNDTIGDEDCLYLNVYTNDMNPLKKRAVMVWIHGAGLWRKEHTPKLYGPDYFMRKDVVLVTLNYRLGVLGFLNFYKEMATGNQGLKDVVMALEWVRRNILQFGGDSDSVTIFGQNTGGMMVHYLTISPLAKGLFHKAICQSGAATVPWAFNERDDAINNGLMLAQKLGITTSDPKTALKFLKDIDGSKLTDIKIDLLGGMYKFTPTVDSESSNPFLPENPLQLLRNGITIPIIFGHNSQEGNLFMNYFYYYMARTGSFDKINSNFEEAIYPRILRQLAQLRITVPELRSLYFGNKTVSWETEMDLFDFIGDQHINRGIIQAVDAQMNSNVNHSTYLYRFSYEKSKNSISKEMFYRYRIPGTTNFEVLSYLFHPHMRDALDISPFAHDTSDYKIMKYLTQMWTDFAKTGNPTLSSANFTWTPVKNGTTYDYLDINNEPQMKILIKGNQRWDWENRLNLSKEPSADESMYKIRVKVNVSEGTLEGIVDESVYGDSYNAFRGIPYAKPPVGDLRFRDPQPPEPWFGDRDASFYRNVSLQKDVFWNDTIGDEDCLYLNVYTNDMNPLNKRAVMVWIHGAGLWRKEHTPKLYGPDYFMRKDVVLVTLNYRLGVLGFLNFYKEMATGNQGLKDVVMALEWVRRNILQFGGDSDSVTIFGQNTGGMMVHYLTISPLAKGLFHKAICQSGVATVAWAFTEQNDAINNGLMLAQKLGNATSDPEIALQFLKNIDGSKLTDIKIDLLDGMYKFTPTVDSESSNPFLPENPLQLLRNGITIPIIFGHNSQEGNLFMNYFYYYMARTGGFDKINSNFEEAIYPRILRQLPQLRITVPELRSLYFDNKTVSWETEMDLFDFIGDQHINRGIIQAIDAQMNSNVNQSTYLYRFSYESKNSFLKEMFYRYRIPGTTNFEVLSYLFHPHIRDALDISPFAHDTSDYKIMEYLTQMWTDFAKTGNPTLSSANCTWTPVKNGTTYDYLDINNEPQMKILIKGDQRWDWENRLNLSKEASVNVAASSYIVKVNVSEGTLVGKVDESIYGSYNAFLGIPYAKPPVGDLRFQDPQPPEPWSSDKSSSVYGRICVQMNAYWDVVIGNENCLYLNVYTNDMNPLKKRAVMVWIHGGGFFVGDSTSIIYGPEYIMRKDVVLVTLNYRLGVLGFLNLYKEMATGNQGLKDVVMALKWVQRNILQFGGDPQNVTIFGQDAGGAMVHYLTISPLAKGLFHKAICQSGVATVPWAFSERDDAINYGLKLAQKLGNATSDPEVALKFLKDIDVTQLIRTEAKDFDILLAFTPTVDSESPNPFLPENPLQLLRNGITVPIIFGYNSQESNSFISSSSLNRMKNKTFEEYNLDFNEAIHPSVLRQLPQLGITVPELRSLYFSNETVPEETIMGLSDFIGDQHFYRGIIQAIDTQINSNVNESAYLYKFSYESDTSPMKKIFFTKPPPGTFHYEELGYLFYPNALQGDDVLPFAHNTSNYRIMEYLSQMWTDFAKTGNPTHSLANLTWIPVKNGTTYDYLDINNETQMKILIKGNQRWDWENRLNSSKGYTKLEQFSGTEPFTNHTKLHTDFHTDL